VRADVSSSRREPWDPSARTPSEPCPARGEHGAVRREPASRDEPPAVPPRIRLRRPRGPAAPRSAGPLRGSQPAVLRAARRWTVKRRSTARVGLLSVTSGAPEHELPQERAREFAQGFFADDFGDSVELAQLLGAFENAGIQTRQLAAPPEWFMTRRTFAEKNALYVESAVSLSRAVAEQAIMAAGGRRSGLGAVVFVSSTGIATPSLDARLVQELDLPRDIARLPLWGLGCAGGSAGLCRSLALARGLGRPVLLVACELCSLTF